MKINSNHPELWNRDTMESVSQFNEWFLSFAPQTFIQTRIKTTSVVSDVFKEMKFFKHLTGPFLLFNPNSVEVLRMCTCPPIARDRLAGLSGASKNLIQSVEKNPDAFKAKSHDVKVLKEFEKIARTILRILDYQLFPWIKENREPTSDEIGRAMLVVADRLCGSQSDPIIRNAQEHRQLQAIKNYLENRGYRDVTGHAKFNSMPSGTFMFRSNVPGKMPNGSNETVNLPIDVLIKRKKDGEKDLPIMIECKSAGDFANVNKRRKEEATKIQQLKLAHGKNICFLLFLCGYFDAPYLGYEAAEGIDWIWEHRIEDLDKCGI